MAVAIAVAAALAAVLGFAATKPSEFRIQRSARINASPAAIFHKISNFHNWSAWSPWEKMDPQMKRTFSGCWSGKGAVYEWDGNKKVGQGRMEISDSSPPDHLAIKLDFLKPFEAHNTTEFRLDPSGDATDVTWAMSGHRPYTMKLMGLFMSMDKMIGKDFEKGLASLKALAEG